jgi:hypothetical protein
VEYALIGSPAAHSLDAFEDALLASGLARELVEPNINIEWWEAPGAWIGGLPSDLAIAVGRALGVSVTIAVVEGTRVALQDENGSIDTPARDSVFDLTEHPPAGIRWFPLAVAVAPTPASLRAVLDDKQYTKYRLELAVDHVLAARDVPRPARRTRGFHGWRPCPPGEEPYWVTLVREAPSKRLEVLKDGRATLHVVSSDNETIVRVIDEIELALLRTWFDDQLTPTPRAVALSPSRTRRRQYRPGEINELGNLVLKSRLVGGAFELSGRSTAVELSVPFPAEARDEWIAAKLTARSPKDARSFLEEICAWLGVEVPEPTGLAVDANFNWYYSKLMLQADEVHAEVYVNLHAGGRPEEIVELLQKPHLFTMVEKDRGQRRDLVRLLVNHLAPATRLVEARP